MGKWGYFRWWQMPWKLLGYNTECWDGGGCWAVVSVVRGCLSEEEKSGLRPHAKKEPVTWTYFSVDLKILVLRESASCLSFKVEIHHLSLWRQCGMNHIIIIALVLCIACSNGKATMLFNPKLRMRGLTWSMWAGWALLDIPKHDYYHW